MSDSYTLTTEDSKEWGELLDSMPKRDVHFTSQYSKLFEEYLKSKALLYVFVSNGNTIIYPFFMRRINDIKTFDALKVDTFDIISTWYYGGPISNVTDKNKEMELFQKFLPEFETFCVENRIVSEFCRFHPFFKNHLTFYDSEMNREVVYIDLMKGWDEIYGGFKKENRKAIRKSERSGMKIIRSNDKADVKRFYEIYVSSMERKSAKSFYFFNIDFFNDMFELLKDSATMFFAEYNGKTVVVSLVLHKYGIVHDYLRGSAPEFFHLRPNNLIVKEIAKWAQENGNEIYSLGGGTTTDPNDTKLRFKSMFSRERSNFFIYKKIHDKDTYERLCKNYCNSSNYFPLYRCEE